MLCFIGQMLHEQQFSANGAAHATERLWLLSAGTLRWRRGRRRAGG